MTQELSRPSVPPTRRPLGRARPRVPVRLVLVVAVLGLFLALKLPAWLASGPAQAPVTLNPDFPFHYAVFVAHIATGSIAFLTVCLQLWPWLRRRHPRLHRISGRMFVFGGMVPTTLLAVPLVVAGTLTPFGRVGLACWIVLSLVTTGGGWWYARRRRIARHRVWMLFSVAMATNVITSRVFTFAVFSIPFVGPDILERTQGQLEGPWLSWMINLALATWWVRRRPRPTPSAVPGPGAGTRARPEEQHEKSESESGRTAAGGA